MSKSIHKLVSRLESMYVMLNIFCVLYDFTYQLDNNSKWKFIIHRYPSGKNARGTVTPKCNEHSTGN